MMRPHSSKRAFTLGRALALLPFSLLTLLGCAQIIGLGDYTVGTEGGAGGAVSSGGNSGKAGAGANGGKANGAAGEGTAGEATAGAAGEGTAGESGAPGETGGTGGNTNNGGAAGKSSSVGGASGSVGRGGAGGTTSTTPVGCDGTPITMNEQVVRSCILRVSCDPFDPVRTISTCVTNNTQEAFAGEKCNLTSTTCDDYTACEHKGIAGDDLCPTAKWGTNFCVGNKAVSCDPNGVFSSYVDCIGQGGTACGTYTDSDGTVQAACKVNETCTGDADYQCSSETTPLYEYQCVGTQAYGFKCGDFAYCGDDTNGDATCFLTATTCGADSTTCSTSNVAKVCSGGGEYDYDCGSVGLTCKAVAANNQTDYCLAPGCSPGDATSCTESCTGSKLNFCYGGAQVTVNCTDYGFSDCEDFSDATPAYSACVND